MFGLNKVVYGRLKCPEDCKNYNVMCEVCNGWDYFDADAQ